MKHVLPNDINKYRLKYDPQWFIILGMRSNGKSSAVKSLCVKNVFEDHSKKFCYLRRYKEDTKSKYVNSYFKTVPGFDVPKITGGEWDGIILKGLELYFYKYDEEENKQILSSYNIGYVTCLADQEHDKSMNFPDVDAILFEEFITKKPYLTDEFSIMFDIVSSIARNHDVCVYLVGNTISLMCPYFQEFNLSRIRTQKIDTIDIYKYDNTTIACWLTAPLTDDSDVIGQKNRMFFGTRARMINAGEWERREHRKPEHRGSDYTTIYNMVLNYNQALFLMEFRRTKDGGHVWHVSRKTTPIQPGTRIISNENIENEKTTIGFIPLSPNESIIFNYLKNGKISYSDDLTGTEFKEAVRQLSQIK